MAKIITIKSGARFPRKPKGSPAQHFAKPGNAASRGLGTGNNRWTKPNNWRPGEKFRPR